MWCNFLHVMVLLTSSIFVTNSYHLRVRNTEFSPNPDLDLFKFLNKWMLSTDHRSHNESFPEVIYTLHTIPHEGRHVPHEESQDEDYYDLGYLSFVDQEHLKNVGSIEEIVEITGLHQLLEQNTDGADEEATFTSDLPLSSSSYSMPQHTNEDSETLKVTGSIDGVTLRNAELRRKSGSSRRNALNNQHDFAQRALCEPEKVSVPLEADVGFRVIPSCVRIKQCGGCCNPGLMCVPTKTKQLKVKVVELALDNTSLQYKVLENVTEHEECGCQCRVQEQDCLPTQDYHLPSCSCLCKRNLVVVRRDCESRGHFWDNKQCTCQCPLQGPRSSSDCGSGQTFNSLTCSCDNE